MFLEDYRIPGSMVRDDVDEHLHSATVRGGDQLLQIPWSAELGIDGIVIPHRIGTAQRTLGLELADGMNGHEPDHVHAQ
jgi:hypothetical protein